MTPYPGFRKEKPEPPQIAADRAAGSPIARVMVEGTSDEQITVLWGNDAFKYWI